MARSRNIKPGFFRNEDLAELPFGCRLLFIGLWTIADRDGRLEDRPKKIAAEVFPYDRTAPVDKWLELLASGHDPFIVRYCIGEARYIALPKWGKHQNPHVKEQASTIPAPGFTGAIPGLVPAIPAQAGLDSLIPDSLIPDSPLPAVISISRQSKPPKEWPYGEMFKSAWDRHNKHRGRTETLAAVARVLIGMEDLNWLEVEEKHPKYCAYWDRKGWDFCPLTFLEWIQNGMPRAPDEKPKSESREQLGEAYQIYIDPFKHLKNIPPPDETRPD